LDPITAVALDVGFQDLSNFVRTFRAEFGVSPGRYRAGAYPPSTSALSPA